MLIFTREWILRVQKIPAKGVRKGTLAAAAACVHYLACKRCINRLENVKF